ncbi:MAG: PpiC-type peptidyl-prolyl cis-trans isomerase [Patescibacteria group bacterium]|nr:PpiC-type peptidyl-prolyl cis-trans isomerase [Patescibacteria group bacterium]
MPNSDEGLAKDQVQPEVPEKKTEKTDKPKKAEVKTEPKDEVVPEEKTEAAVEPEPVAVVTPDGPAKKKRNLKRTLIMAAAVVVGLLAVVIVVFGVLIYAYKSDNPAVKVVAQVLPYPVQNVNGQFVSYKDYLFEVDANERAYQNNAKLNNQPAVDFKSADGKKLVTQIKQHSLQKLQGDALVAQLADQKKVKVTDKEVNDLVNQLYTRYGGKDTLLKTLSQIYGWKLDDLKRVVRKQLLTKNLEAKVTSDPAVDAAAKAKAQDVLKKVKDGGDFAALAKQYSQASDAASGGDLGFFSKGQLPDNVQAAAEALQPGQVSDAIKTQYGYEVLKVIEKKDDGSIHAQHILIKTVDFNQYFQDQLKKAKIKTYLKV